MSKRRKGEIEVARVTIIRLLDKNNELVTEVESRPGGMDLVEVLGIMRHGEWVLMENERAARGDD